MKERRIRSVRKIIRLTLNSKLISAEEKKNYVSFLSEIIKRYDEVFWLDKDFTYPEDPIGPDGLVPLKYLFSWNRTIDIKIVGGNYSNCLYWRNLDLKIYV